MYSKVAIGASLSACLGLCLTAAPASAAVPGVAGAAKVRAAADIPDPWVEKGGHSVSFAGGKGSSVEAVSGNELQVRLKNVSQGVLINPSGGIQNLGRAAIAGQFADLKGKVKGVLVGKTTGGQPLEVPVVFTSGVSGGKTLSLTAKPVGGQVPDELAEVFPALHPVESEMVGSRMRFVGVHATDGGARTWRLSAATRSGALKANGAEGFTVRLPKAPKRGVGVQMGHEAAGLSWSFVNKNWDTLAERGVPARLVVQGIGKRSITRTVVLDVESFKDGKTLRFSGDALSQVSGKAKKALRTMRGAAVTLVSSNSGLDKSFVVITGDSISSGESGRYIADYESAGWFTGMGPQQYEKFCKFADLACTSAKAEGDPGGTTVAAPKVKVDYNDDPKRVYEKGTHGPNQCHRSFVAPGTWLARYYSTQQGKKVESINIACSGATTEAMTKTFNGQRPQAEVLSEISNAVHVPFVTNTMGANDIGFSGIAIGCYMGVAGPFLNSDTDDAEAGNLVDSLMAQLPTLLDSEWNPWFGKQKVKGENKFENYNPYCSDNPQIGGAAEKAVKKLPALYEKAMKEVLDAAPHAKVLAHNYPNLIPHNSQSNLPRKQYFGKNPMSFEGDFLAALTDPDSTLWAVNVALNNFNTPPDPDFDKWTYDQLKANQKKWADYFYQRIIMGSFLQGNSFVYPIIATLNLLYAQDMNWAAWKLIPALDDAVYDTAKSMGGRVIPVDMREVLNGREYTTAYKGAPGANDAYLIYDNGDFYLDGGRTGTLQSIQHSAYNYESLNSWNNSPDMMRATFVTAPLAGLDMTIPVLCPGNEERGDFTHNGKVSNGRCIGSMNEPLHPNWRGQAAQGQCLTAVVTGMAGEGNACVRSVGNNEFSGPNEGAGWGFLKTVDSADSLCVVTKPRDDYGWKQVTPDKPYSLCSSGVAADPTWDSERWAKVAEYGNWK